MEKGGQEKDESDRKLQMSAIMGLRMRHEEV